MKKRRITGHGLDRVYLLTLHSLLAPVARSGRFRDGTPVHHRQRETIIRIIDQIKTRVQAY
jgi:hypothetical protein